MSNYTSNYFDWPAVREKVDNLMFNQPDSWLLLGEQLPVTLYETIRQQKIVSMRGVQVTRRNQQVRKGKRYADIYVKGTTTRRDDN